MMEADRGHFHHRLIDLGFTHKQSVFILRGLSVFAGIIAFLIALEDLRAVFVALMFFFAILLMLYVYSKRING